MQLKKQRSESKIVCSFSIILNLKVLKSKRPCILLMKKINFDKTIQNRKLKTPNTVLERRSFCFNSYKNRKLKVKLWWVGARKQKRGYFLYRSFCPKEIFLIFAFYLNVWRIEYTFRIYILLHIQNHYFIHFCCSFLKFAQSQITKPASSKNYFLECQKFHIRSNPFQNFY